MSKHDHLVVAIAGSSLVVSDDPENCSRKGPDVVNWKSPDGAVQVYFNKNGTPFINGSVFTSTGPDKETFPAAVVSKTAELRAYDYTVTVTLPDNTQINADPQVIIDDGRFRTQQLLSFVTAGVEQAVTTTLSQLAQQVGDEEVNLEVSARVGSVEVSISVGPSFMTDPSDQAV